MGFLPMLRTMSWLRMLPLDKPTKTSASLSASSRVRSLVARAKRFFSSVRSVRSAWMTPLESQTVRFSGFTPRARYRVAQLMALAPAPLNTTLTLLIFFLTTSRPFSRAAPVMMAVPCWSSCMTGMSSSSRKRCSM